MLLELADLLESLPDDRFDYSEWVGEDWEGDPTLSCGTRACAAGWATTLSSFREAGLRLSCVFIGPRGGGTMMTDRNSGVAAIAEVLGIPIADASSLFIPSSFGSPGPLAGPAEVAEHIRLYVDHTTKVDVGD